ncbi:hypothetical protein TorRG33x02_220330 [Trema orientale]|uniref:Uncharacterized protein n=1 Tax=Trema orientale TaxID=63057 RepID=A0A2P5E9F0_TREOI|nr:hypothetical protein TorRG33x02_220330 [Trema orientale]
MPFNGVINPSPEMRILPFGSLNGKQDFTLETTISMFDSDSNQLNGYSKQGLIGQMGYKTWVNRIIFVHFPKDSTGI